MSTGGALDHPNQDHHHYYRNNPILSWLPDGLRSHVVAIIGEFCGTTIFLLFAYLGTQAAQFDGKRLGTSNYIGQPSNTSQLLYIALSFGFSLAVTAWAFFRISGSFFNPATTLAFMLTGNMGIIRGVFIFATQIVGGIAAAGIASSLTPDGLYTKTKLGGGTSKSRGTFIEVFLTALLVFTVLMLAAERNRSTYLAPVGIGLAEFITMMAGVYFTGASMNPARSFGPCVIMHDFEGYHWIYWVGPLGGALVATGFYWLLKILEYETANPMRDVTDPDPEKNARGHGDNGPHNNIGVGEGVITNHD